MTHYAPPLRDLRFLLHEVLDASAQLRELPAHAAVDAELIDQVLEQAGRFCAEVLHPLNARGDIDGCRWDPHSGAVTTPDGFRDAWRQYVAAGWPGLTAPEDCGGQQLPQLLGSAVHEMENAANQAWAMFPGLTRGALELLRAHGSAAQRQLYLPRLASGAWTGTMCLTEPQCGTDLGLLRTRAEPRPDGSYALTGQKIFISCGEHDLADNIVHMVLARLPDAPPGSKGISLFVVPKFWPDADGAPGARNAVVCTGIEHKMGLHANPTCAISLDGARGELVGAPHQGLAAMFVMMNGARLGVGLQSLGLTELAWQNALAYASDRLQMRALSGARHPELAADPILVHPDVRRMLLTMRAWAEGGRFLAYWVALLLDQSHQHPDPARRDQAASLVALLTPVVKAFLTDNGCEATNLALQVWGGHGYIRDNGIEQLVRDARVNTLYEGTNGIQALDLLGRKVLADHGRGLQLLTGLVAAVVEQHGVDPDLQDFVNPLERLAGEVERLAAEVGMQALADRDAIGAAAVPFLRLLGHLCVSYAFTRIAATAQAAIRGGSADPYYRARLQVARFYVTRLYPETASARLQVRAGAASLQDTDAVFS